MKCQDFSSDKNLIPIEDTCFQAVNEWMKLPPELRNPMPPNIFKRHLNNYFLQITLNN